jgi:hypothetical protein
MRLQINNPRKCNKKLAGLKPELNIGEQVAYMNENLPSHRPDRIFTKSVQEQIVVAGSAAFLLAGCASQNAFKIPRGRGRRGKTCI